MDFKALKSTRSKLLVGLVFLGLLIISSISRIFTESDFLANMITLFLIIGLAVFLKKKYDYYNILIEKAESYYVLVNKHRETPISVIASHTSDSEDMVISVFEELIKKQVSENYAMDLQKRVIVDMTIPSDDMKVTIKTEVKKVKTVTQNQETTKQVQKSGSLNVKCTQCGAMNVVTAGQGNYCDYCSSVLSNQA